jgi:hypothetical protein
MSLHDWSAGVGLRFAPEATQTYLEVPYYRGWFIDGADRSAVPWWQMEVPSFKGLPSLKHVELIVDPCHWEFFVSEQDILDGGTVRDEEFGAIYRGFVACKTYVEVLHPGVTCTVNAEIFGQDQGQELFQNYLARTGKNPIV